MSYLNMFRRKPAITRSDWHFTAFQDSSENYATFTRSIHYNLVLKRSPSFGSNRSNLSNTNFQKEDHFFKPKLAYIVGISLFLKIRIQNYKILLVSPVAFARAFNLATPINLLTHYAKGTPSFLIKLRLLIELLIQAYFTVSLNISAPNQCREGKASTLIIHTFQLFLYSTFHYR